MVLSSSEVAACDATLRRAGSLRTAPSRTVRHYLTADLLQWVESEDLTVLMVTHDLEEAVTISDRVVLLGNGPRAQIKFRFAVPIERPRDLMRAREHPEFTPLIRRLWDALSDEVRTPGRHRGGERKAVNQ